MRNRLAVIGILGLALTSSVARAETYVSDQAAALVVYPAIASGLGIDTLIQISNTSTITALTVTVTIQRTGNIAFSGQYNTVGGQITQSHTQTSTAVTYQFVLTAGQTLGAANGRIFAAQTSGTGTVHPTAGDTYTVTYTTGGQNFTKSGGF